MEAMETDSCSSETKMDVTKKLTDKMPCRGPQIRNIQSLMGQNHQYTIPALFVYGHTGTGKSMVVNTILQDLKHPHVVVNCIECYNSRFLYETILNNIHRHSGTNSDVDVQIKCDNMNDFVRKFSQVITEKQMEKETVYIVLDKAERIREMDANILPAFLRLQELTQQNICIILLSEIVWEKFRTGTGYCEPFILHFPDYSKDELIRIMMLDKPEGDYSDEFYQMYLNLVLSVFHIVCRDLNELRHLASINFQKYTEPIKTNEASMNDTRKLWKNIEPHLKKALQTVYLREVSSSQWERIQQETELSQTPSLQGLSSRTHVELPYYSKYLLIASYLASYNPAKTDKRFFAKQSSKTKKSKTVRKHERTSNHMLGPKQFAMDRLMAIFYSIAEGRVAPTANIFMQISSLVSLHLLAQVAGDDQIDVPKYKCLVSLDFIKSVARTLGFDVMRYLYDFV